MMNEIKKCPFCGSRVDFISLFTGMKMFYCSNYKECGAVVSFNNEKCDNEEGNDNKIMCWNRRVT